MVRMLFTLPQEKVKIVKLPNEKYDVTILQNEETESVPSGIEGISVRMYAYDGNQFRTVYALTEKEILDDLENWMAYDTASEPTQEEIAHDNAIIDQYTIELLEAGIL